MNKQDVNTIVSAVAEIDWARFARRQYVRTANAKYSAASVSATAKPCCQPPTAEELSLLAVEHARVETSRGRHVSYAEALEVVSQDGSSRSRYSHALERRVNTLGQGMAALQQSFRSNHAAEIKRDQIVEHATKYGLSYSEAAKACGYPVASSIPDRITGRGA